MVLLVFSVTPFKIDQNKNQNRPIDKVQNLGNKRRYIYKDPRQDSGQGIFRIRDIRRNVLPKFIDICMEKPCWCSPGMSSNMADGKPTETSVTEFCYKSVILFLEKLINIKVILFLTHELFK